MAKNSISSAPSSSTELERFLERAGAKERLKFEKHLAVLDSDPDPARGQLWRRLVVHLGELTPQVGVQTVGKNAWRFFIPDGKYRKQMFALEDPGNGTMLLYMPNMLNEALRLKLIRKTDSPNRFTIPGSSDSLHIDELDAENSPTAAPHYEHMLGWNRKALRITLPITRDTGRVDAALALADLAAQAWQEPA